MTAPGSGGRPDESPGAAHVVAVDFGRVGMGMPLAELLADFPVSRVRVVNPLESAWRSPDESWFDRIRAATAGLIDGGLGPHPAVVGQCTGALFAVDLAAQLAKTGLEPTVVLIEPEQVTRALIGRQVHGLVSRLGGEAHVAASLIEDLPLRDGRLPDLATMLQARLRDVARIRVVRLSLDEETAHVVIDEIVGWYTDWICYLAVQLSVRHAASPNAVHVLGEAGDETLALLRAVSPTVRVVVSPPAQPASIANQLRQLLPDHVSSQT